MAQGGYYTKGYIAELEELERGSKWAPTHDFCENFSIRFQEAQMKLTELDDKGKLHTVCENLGELVNTGMNPIFELAISWALYNNYNELEKTRVFFTKINLGQWVEINDWLHGDKKKDIDKVIRGLIAVRETLL